MIYFGLKRILTNFGSTKISDSIMTKAKLFISALLVSVASAVPASAADLLDTSVPTFPFSLGVRLGVNTSNVTISDALFPKYNKNDWGTGLEAGVVADIKFRNYIAIQPGAFFECHSGNYTYITDLAPQNYQTQAGHLRSYHLTIPVLASVRLNVANIVRWSIDAGPYLSLKLGTGKGDLYNVQQTLGGLPLQDTRIERRACVWGLKLGTGINVLSHYYFGIHYMAGLTTPWKEASYDGHDKAWTFTIGYDF